jgi:hypothetical protein
MIEFLTANGARHFKYRQVHRDDHTADDTS